MWQSAESIDQADAYGKYYTAAALPKMSDVDKFNLLRSLSVTTAGMRAHGEGVMSEEQHGDGEVRLWEERILYLPLDSGPHI